MSEEQFRQTISAIDLSRAQLENVARQQEIVRASIDEHLRAKETLAQYSKVGENEELLVPIGAGVFIHAKAGDRKSCIASIGAGVLMEKEIAEVERILDSRIEELKKAATELDEQAEKITFAIEQLSKEARKQYEALQKPRQGTL
jgi:prefoldin alpha subunit